MAISLLLLLKNTVFCVHPLYFVTRQRCRFSGFVVYPALSGLRPRL